MSASVTLAGQRAEDSLRLRSGQFPRDIANPLVLEQDPADEPVCQRCGASHRAWVPEDADKSDAEADVEAGAVAKADVDVDADFDAAVDASMDDEVRAGTVAALYAAANADDNAAVADVDGDLDADRQELWFPQRWATIRWPRCAKSCFLQFRSPYS